MRAATAFGSFMKTVGRQMFLGALAVATAVLGLALLLAALTTGGDAIAMPEFVARSSDGGDGGPSLVATGYGEATAPAESATLQLVLFNEYGMMPDGGSATGSGSGPDSDDDLVAIQEAMAAPVVEALVALGVPSGDIRPVTSPTFVQPYGGPNGGPNGLRIDVTISDPTLERVNAIVRAAGTAAREDRSMLQQVGVGYTIADCTPLRLLARQRATENARLQARQQAQVLEAEVGAMRVASDVAEPAGDAAVPANGCAVDGGSESPFSPFGFGYGSVPVTLPPYDSTAAPEARAVARISLTYDLVVP